MVQLAATPGVVDDVLGAGNARARALADDTVDEVRQRMGMSYANGRQTFPQGPALSGA